MKRNSRRLASFPLFIQLESRRLLASLLQPDPAFGDSGWTSADFVSTSQAWAVAVAADGKTVAAGNATTSLAVARFGVNGSLDTSFSGDGKAHIAPVGTLNVTDVELQSDGKIVVAGTLDDKFALWRFTTGGALDTNFGTNGTTLVDYGVANSKCMEPEIVIDAQDRIYLAGQLRVDQSSGENVLIDQQFALAAFDAGGDLLSAFSGDGLLITDTPDTGANVRDIALQPDGKILVAGAVGADSGNADYALLRYTTAGALDTNFGGDGIVTTDFGTAAGSTAGSVEYATSIAFWNTQSLGLKIVVGGAVDWNDSEPYTAAAVARYNDDGSLDTTFFQKGVTPPGLDTGRGPVRAIRVASGDFYAAGGQGWIDYRHYDVLGDLGTVEGSLTNQITLPDTASMEAAQFTSDGKLTIAGNIGALSDDDFFVGRIGRSDVALGNDGILYVDATDANGQTISVAPISGGTRLTIDGAVTDYQQTIVGAQINGAFGNDVITVTMNVPCTITGGYGSDSITTGSGNDVITDVSGSDTISAGDGDNTITCGTKVGYDGAGGRPDFITTGTGNDVIATYGNGSQITSGAGNDRVSLTGSGVVSLGAGDDALSAGKLSTTGVNVTGGTGNDTINTSGANDTVNAGDGDDSVSAGHGVNVISGGNGNDTLTGGANEDTIDGGAGSDSISSQHGNDLVYGGDGADWISGGDDNDSIWGDAQGDTLYGGRGSDVIWGNGGNDHIAGCDPVPKVVIDGADTLFGNKGNDAIDGDAGNDVIFGQDGDDKVMAGEGDDVIEGGLGLDRMFGEAGKDTFRAIDGVTDTLNGGDDEDTADADAGIDVLELI